MTEGSKDIRFGDGTRTRGVKEWIKAQGDDPIAQFRIFDPEKEVVLEGWKNARTKQRHITKMRRPSGDELEEFKKKADAKGRGRDMARATREFLGGRPI